MKNMFLNLWNKIYIKGSFCRSVVIGIRFCVALPILVILTCMFFDALPDWGAYTTDGIRLWVLLIIALFEMLQWIIFDRLTLMKALGVGVLAILLGVVFYQSEDVRTAYEIQKCKGDSNRERNLFCLDYFSKQYRLYEPYHYIYQRMEKKEE